jgi:hypothetical protein
LAQAVEIVDELQRMREAALERGLVTAAAAADRTLVCES